MTDTAEWFDRAAHYLRGRAPARRVSQTRSVRLRRLFDRHDPYAEGEHGALAGDRQDRQRLPAAAGEGGQQRLQQRERGDDRL